MCSLIYMVTFPWCMYTNHELFKFWSLHYRCSIQDLYIVLSFSVCQAVWQLSCLHWIPQDATSHRSHPKGLGLLLVLSTVVLHIHYVLLLILSQIIFISFLLSFLLVVKLTFLGASLPTAKVYFIHIILSIIQLISNICVKVTWKCVICRTKLTIMVLSVLFISPPMYMF